jgi:DNA-binding response OmpR family regulator
MPKILVIDDEKMIADMLKDGLEMQGYEVITAYSGKDGLRKSIETIPDAITLDLEMPGMSGFKVLEQLKNNEKTRDISVFILTVRDESDYIDKGYFLGAKEYIVKPISIKKLGESIRTYLN